MLGEGTHPMTVSQGNDIIGLLRDIKIELRSQKSPPGRETKDISQLQDEIIEELSDDMEKYPDRYYAVSISERKIVASDNSEWDLLNRLGHKEIIKIGPKEYPNDDIFIFCRSISSAVRGTSAHIPLRHA